MSVLETKQGLWGKAKWTDSDCGMSLSVDLAANSHRAKWTLDPTSGGAGTEQEAVAGDIHQALSNAVMFKTPWHGRAFPFPHSVWNRFKRDDRFLTTQSSFEKWSCDIQEIEGPHPSLISALKLEFAPSGNNALHMSKARSTTRAMSDVIFFF